MYILGKLGRKVIHFWSMQVILWLTNWLIWILSQSHCSHECTGIWYCMKWFSSSGYLKTGLETIGFNYYLNYVKQSLLYIK